MWIVPSRARPHSLARLIQAWRDTGAFTRVLIALDEDDPTLGAYLALDVPEGWIVRSGRRLPLSDLYNAIFADWPDLGWYGVLADDVLPETEGWDRMLVETAGSDGLAYGYDGIDESHAAHFVLGGDLVRSMGWLSLPGLTRVYIDTVWNDIAKERGVFRYRPDIKMTHLHFSNGKALRDKTYRKPDKARDKALYDAWKKEPK